MATSRRGRLTTELSGRTRCRFAPERRAAMFHGPLQRVVRRHARTLTAADLEVIAMVPVARWMNVVPRFDDGRQYEMFPAKTWFFRSAASTTCENAETPSNRSTARRRFRTFGEG